jgi:HAD superfamily hydrolase (TIGR01458 family)
MQAILFDLDGVLYQARDPIPGAREVVDWLRVEGIPHLFVTNTTSQPLAWVLEKLAAMGIPATADQVLTPAVVARRWLRDQGLGPVALFVSPGTAGDFAKLPRLPAEAESGAGAVVVGNLGRAWDFATLNRAFLLLMENPRAPLVALGIPRYWQGPEGLRLDAGPFVAALEYATGRKAVVLGKPAGLFYRSALEILGTEPESTLMVGDDIRADVDGAQQVGLKGLLVRTGKFRPTDLEEGIKPFAVLDSVTELPEWWREKGRS